MNPDSHPFSTHALYLKGSSFFLAYFSPDCCAETINSCKNHPVSFPVPLTVEPSRLLCPMVTWVRLPNRLVTNLKVSVCPRRSTLFLALFSITYSWDFLSSPSRTIQAFCVVPAFCLSLVRKVSSNAMKKKGNQCWTSTIFYFYYYGNFLRAV